MSKPRAREAAATAGGVVEAVNFNSPGQVVIAGDKAAVLRAIEIAKARGAKRAIELPVSVPVAQQPDEGRGRAAGRTPGDDRDSRAADPLSERRGRAGAHAIPTTFARCWCASCRARCAGPRPWPR